MRPGRRDTPDAARSHGATASGTSQLVSEEAIVFAMLAETLRGTLPK